MLNMQTHRRNQNFFLGGGKGGGADPELHIMFHFKNVMKNMSKSTCCKLLYFSVFQSTCHLPISVAELGCIVYKIGVSLNFALTGASSPPPLGCANNLYFDDST